MHKNRLISPSDTVCALFLAQGVCAGVPPSKLESLSEIDLE